MNAELFLITNYNSSCKVISYKYNHNYLMDYLRRIFSNKHTIKEHQILRFIEEQLQRYSLQGFSSILQYLNDEEPNQLCSKKLHIIKEQVELKMRDFISTQMLNIETKQEFDKKCDFLLELEGVSQRTRSYLTNLKEITFDGAEGRGMIRVGKHYQSDIFEREKDIEQIEYFERQDKTTKQREGNNYQKIKVTFTSILQKCGLFDQFSSVQTISIEQMCGLFQKLMHSYLDEQLLHIKQNRNKVVVSSIVLLKNQIVRQVHNIQSSIVKQLQLKEVDAKLSKHLYMLKDEFTLNLKNMQQSLEQKISEKNTEIKQLNKEMEKLLHEMQHKQNQWKERQHILTNIQKQYLEKQQSEIERLKAQKQQMQQKLSALSKQNKKKKQYQNGSIQKKESDNLIGAKRQLQSIIANIEELKQIQQNVKEENRRYQQDKNGEILQQIKQILHQKINEKSNSNISTHHKDLEHDHEQQNQLLKAKEQVQKQKQTRTKLQNKLQIIKQQNKGLIHNLQTKTQRLKQLEKDYQKIKGEAEQTKKEFKELHLQFDSLKQQNNELADQTTDLKQRVKKFQNEIIHLNKQLKKKQNEFELINSQLVLQRSNHTSLILQYEQIISSKEKLKFQNSELSEINRRLMDEVQSQKSKSMIYDPDSRYQYFFPNDILHKNSKYKKFIIEYLQNRYKIKVEATKPLYKYNQIEKTNFHKYIDNHPHLLVIAQVQNGKIVACYSQAPFKKESKYDEAPFKKESKGKDCLIMSVTNQVVFTLKADVTRPITYDDYFLIFGNSELRFKTGENKIFSNLGVNNGYFEANGYTVDILFGKGRERQLILNSCEMYEIIYQKEVHERREKEIQTLI